MSVKIIMNNNKKFKVDGIAEEWIEKIKSEMVLEVCDNTFILSENISELYEEVKKETAKKEIKK
jgi:predicted acetyltransferase